MKIKPSLVLTGFTVALLLSACGGSEDAAVVPTPTPPPTPTPVPVPVSSFTKNATWDVAFEAKGGELCFDIDTQKAADCAGETWDFKAKSDGRGTSFFSNSGTSGAGKGGALTSPFDSKWADLKKWLNGMSDPVNGALDTNSYIKDFAEGVFTGTNGIKSAAFEYDLAGDHKLSPNFNVFLISEDSTNPAARKFALQITGYYGGKGGAESGFPSIRSVDLANNNEFEPQTIDARNGWAYFDLAKNALSTETGTWHIAFNRNNMKLNSSIAGKPLGGVLSKKPEGFYSADGKAITAKFADVNNLAQTRALLTASDVVPPKPKWLSDKNASPLSPAANGNYPVLDFGWYSYYGDATVASKAGLAAAHMLKANPEAATMIRSAEGNSYARVHLTDIKYADPSNAQSIKTWKFEFDIQPKP